MKRFAAVFVLLVASCVAIAEGQQLFRQAATSPAAVDAASASPLGNTTTTTTAPSTVKTTTAETTTKSESNATTTSAQKNTTSTVVSTSSGVSSAASHSPTPKVISATTTTTTTKSQCFPAHATVELESGVVRRMDELQIGDRVKVGQNMYSDVFMFTHKVAEMTSEFVNIDTASGFSVQLTPGHYIHKVGAGLVPAGSVNVGDNLILGSGVTSAVTQVGKTMEDGLYNPQTLHGDIVVDGIVSSTYTTAVSPLVGHASLAPLRILYSSGGITTATLETGLTWLRNALVGTTSDC